MVTKIDMEIQAKILAEYTAEEIKAVQQEWCTHCKNWDARYMPGCRVGLLPVTSAGSFCQYYMA